MVSLENHMLSHVLEKLKTDLIMSELIFYKEIGAMKLYWNAIKAYHLPGIFLVPKLRHIDLGSL